MSKLHMACAFMASVSCLAACRGHQTFAGAEDAHGDASAEVDASADASPDVAAGTGSIDAGTGLDVSSSIAADAYQPPVDASAEANDTPPPSAEGFVVTATFDHTFNHRGEIPRSHDFTLFFRPGAQPSMTVGAGGAATTMPLQSMGGGRFRAERAQFSSFFVSLQPQAGLETPICVDLSYQYQWLEFTMEGDRLRGTFSGVAVRHEADVLLPSAAVGGTLDGKVDRDPPRIVLPANTPTPVNPAEGVAFVVTEPIASGTRWRLSSARGDVASTVMGFEDQPQGLLLPERVLRFGAAYELTLEPWSDLPGNAGARGPALRLETIPDPGVMAEDGFEGPVSARFDGETRLSIDARLADGTPLPPMSGGRSVYLPGQITNRERSGASKLTARLKVEPGDRYVRFRARSVGRNQPSRFQGVLLLVAPGGRTFEHAEPLALSSDTGRVIGSAGDSFHLGTEMMMQLPLPMGTTDEVILYATTYWSDWGCHVRSSTGGLELDDLRVE